MATIEKKSLERLKVLYYDKQLSVQDVANELRVSIDAVFYCMRKNGLNRRAANETNLIKFERSATSFKLRKIDCEELRMLKVIGIMLYWGEGCKSDKTRTVDFANSDKDMIRLFLKFLREICGIDKKKLRVLPYLYANQNIERCLSYWSNITEISRKQFTKPYIRQDFNEAKKDRMPNGMIHIRYADKKLLSLIKQWIEEYRAV